MRLTKPTIPTDAEHSEFSPSGSKRWINCPASIKMLREAPKRGGSSFYAEEGTAAHELGAVCLEDESQPDNYIGKEYNKFTVDKSMAREIKKYTDYVSGQVTWDSELYIETKVPMFEVEENMFGTADAIIVSEEAFEIIDLKYGRGVLVEVEENYQLMVYALGVLFWAKRNGYHYSEETEVTLTIVQPRAPHLDGPIRSWKITIAALLKFLKEAQSAVKAAESEYPPFGPSAENCKWCEASPFCKSYADHNLEIAKLEFADFAKTKNEFSKSLLEVNSLTPEQLSNIMKHGKALEQWIKSIAEYAIEEMKRGTQVPKFKLVYGRSIRAWEDQDLVHKLLEEHGVGDEDIYTQKFKSPTQMEKTLSPDEWEMIKDQVFKPTGKVTLAPETDGRKAVDPNVEAKDEWS